MVIKPNAQKNKDELIPGLALIIRSGRWEIAPLAKICRIFRDFVQSTPDPETYFFLDDFRRRLPPTKASFNR